jgi:hypothetical protein
MSVIRETPTRLAATAVVSSSSSASLSVTTVTVSVDEGDLGLLIDTGDLCVLIIMGELCEPCGAIDDVPDQDGHSEMTTHRGPLACTEPHVDGDPSETPS